MSTMTINGKLAPLPDDPDALLVDVVATRSTSPAPSSSAGPACAAPAPCWSTAYPP